MKFVAKIRGVRFAQFFVVFVVSWLFSVKLDDKAPYCKIILILVSCFVVDSGSFAEH